MIDYPALFERSPNPYMLLDRDFRIVDMNDAYLRVTGRERSDLLGTGLFEAFPGDPADPDDSNVRELRASIQGVFDTGAAHTLGLIRYAIPVATANGVVFEERFWSATHTPLFGPGGAVRHVLQHTVDVTELQRLKAELHEVRRARQGLAPEQVEHGVFERARQVQQANQALESQRRHLLKLFDEAPGFMAYLSGPEHVYELVNHAYLALIGHRDVIGLTIRDALPDIDGQGYYELLDTVYRSGKAFVGTAAPVEIERAGGRELVYVDFVYQPVFDAQGAVTGILVQGHDISLQKAAQAELERYRYQLEDLVQARTRALERSEAALAQARKLEDIGKLTGGVAHDFNNVLQVIAANLQLLDVEALPGALRGHARSAMQGVERGAKLASQLLAFARRQPLQPVVLALGEHLAGLDTLLRRSLGEAVELRVEIAPDLCNVEADPHQLDNALINLALNARDAMQGRGRLVLSAQAIEVRAGEDGLAPGHYALLTLVDNGVGMTSEVLAQAFEPFFTTKDVGQGTGLGLSMVYGFVKQSGGHVAISSVPGAGTEVRIWLPRSLGLPRLAIPASQPPVGGSETVLVVEDDAAVRESVVSMLEGLGYRVVAAADGSAGLAALAQGLRADVLFTDVVMPGPIGGFELARQARARFPGLPVVFTTGYSPEGIGRDGRFEDEVRLLAKPYRREELARKLREALDGAPRAGTPAAQPLRVLLVEDDADNRAVTADLLRLLGHAPRAVGSAGEGLAALGEGHWDVLLCDLRLPDFPGTVLCQRAREMQPGLRVVLASGADRAALLRVPEADAVLQKPYPLEALQAALHGDCAPPRAVPLPALHAAG